MEYDEMTEEDFESQRIAEEYRYENMKDNIHDLQERIDKATEYIKNNQWYSVDYGDNILDAKEILEILKGE